MKTTTKSREHNDGAAARGVVKVDARVAYDFHGDRLEVVEHDGEHFVVLARLCEPLELQVHGQAAKLKRLPWAGGQIICAPTAGGMQESFCIPIRSVAGWLFSVNAQKVRPELQEKLVRYQRECADALADHFLGPRRFLTANVAALHQRVEELEALVEAAERDRAAVEVQLQQLQHDASGVIGRVRAQRWILAILKEAARLHCAAAGDHSERTFLREFKDRENQVRLHVHFPASLAQRWESLPLEKFGEAQSKALEIREREKRRMKSVLRELRARVEQLELPLH